MSAHSRSVPSLGNAQYNAHIFRTESICKRFQSLFSLQKSIVAKCNDKVNFVNVPNIVGIPKSTTPRVEVKLGPFTVNALVDSGSVRTIISSKVFDELQNLRLVKSVERSNIKCYTASSEPLSIQCSATFKIKISHFTWTLPCLVSKELGLDFILGADFMRQAGLILDIQSNHIFFKFEPECKIPFVDSGKPSQNLSSEIAVEPDVKKKY